MSKVDKLYNEYNEIKDKLTKNRSLNLKEDLKNKLIELDYVINEEYEKELENAFPMTTTLEKEEERLEKLISFVEEKQSEQKKLIDEYKKVTGEVIELSYLKYSDNLKNYKERLNNVKKILAIIADIKDILKNKDNENELRLKVIKNRLLKKELLNLLYEFCLIDNLDIEEIEVDKLIKANEYNEEVSLVSELNPVVKSSKKERKKETKKETNKIEDKDNTIIAESIKQEVSKKDETKVEETKKDKKIEEIKTEKVEEPEQKETEENILTSMPIVEKIGSVVPVNVFESLQKTEEKLPDVVLPSNGLKDDENDIFIDTKDLFEETEKK